ncbi:TetR/AcrR family transcriptional regulator [Pseudodesulfovibrio sp.]
MGFAAASVFNIAGAAGVSPAMLYTYFENKDVLQSIWNNIFVYVSESNGD